MVRRHPSICAILDTLHSVPRGGLWAGGGLGARCGPGGRCRRLMRLLPRERAGEHRLERPGASQNQTPATSTNHGSAAARASLRAARDPSLVQRNAGLGTTLVTTATMGVLFGRRRTCRSVRHRPKPLRDTARTAGNRRRNGAFKEVCTEGLALRIAFLALHLYRSRRLCAE
jgi:hypothetical protein